MELICKNMLFRLQCGFFRSLFIVGSCFETPLGYHEGDPSKFFLQKLNLGDAIGNLYKLASTLQHG
jgi:hypothetical protein